MFRNTEKMGRHRRLTTVLDWACWKFITAKWHWSWPRQKTGMCLLQWIPSSSPPQWNILSGKIMIVCAVHFPFGCHTTRFWHVCCTCTFFCILYIFHFISSHSSAHTSSCTCTWGGRGNKLCCKTARCVVFFLLRCLSAVTLLRRRRRSLFLVT